MGIFKSLRLIQPNNLPKATWDKHLCQLCVCVCVWCNAQTNSLAVNYRQQIICSAEKLQLKQVKSLFPSRSDSLGAKTRARKQKINWDFLQADENRAACSQGQQTVDGFCVWTKQHMVEALYKWQVVLLSVVFRIPQRKRNPGRTFLWEQQSWVCARPEKKTDVDKLSHLLIIVYVCSCFFSTL